MRTNLALAALALAAAAAASAADVTYSNHIRPMFKKLCDECHGANPPTRAEFKLAEEKFKKDKLGPRTDTYDHLIALVGWPDTGALMRRLDDGGATADGKPGNMYKHLGESDAERAANLHVIKAWVGEDAWKLNRWKKRGDVPAAAKEDLEKLKLAY